MVMAEDLNADGVLRRNRLRKAQKYVPINVHYHPTVATYHPIDVVAMNILR